MPSRRAEEVRRRIAKRRRERLELTGGLEEKPQKPVRSVLTEEEKFGFPELPASYEAEPVTEQKPGHPLFKSNLFMLKLLLSACLVLFAAITFKNQSPVLDNARTFITSNMEKEFQFAAVSSWYQKQFGQPLAFFQQNEKDSSTPKQYAVPASGKVLESFKDNGQGIMVETNKPAVDAMNEGIVISAGENPETGLTVVLQHADGSESWYGHLTQIDVSLYDFVKTGKEIGSIKEGANKKGTYYFAIKKGERFIDPIQVISFD
ncbi:M23 family metallopeptidase [Metabacillus sp. GX 13764]|uniref:M23 family metallopeptidase n=1 Tax=Metabacillus kandeliae TaxID=2900151 RepID=UPI001E593020|nr:M23 family metallopeptidase [Metabacillus kandeliae]MCD7032928.1 M23 family metallopeptidase [Metabacillus kandeliae]